LDSIDFSLDFRVLALQQQSIAVTPTGPALSNRVDIRLDTQPCNMFYFAW